MKSLRRFLLCASALVVPATFTFGYDIAHERAEAWAAILDSQSRQQVPGKTTSAVPAPLAQAASVKSVKRPSSTPPVHTPATASAASKSPIPESQPGKSRVQPPEETRAPALPLAGPKQAGAPLPVTAVQPVAGEVKSVAQKQVAPQPAPADRETLAEAKRRRAAPILAQAINGLFGNSVLFGETPVSVGGKIPSSIASQAGIPGARLARVSTNPRGCFVSAPLDEHNDFEFFVGF